MNNNPKTKEAINLLVVQDAVRPGTHAVDGPLGVAMLVADGDAEAAVVGPDEVDHVTRVALHVEGGALARVRRPVARPLCRGGKRGSV